MKLGGAAGGRGEKPSDVLGVSVKTALLAEGQTPPPPRLRQAEEQPNSNSGHW